MQIPFWQRLLAPLMYLLPWSDAIPFGLGVDGVFNQIPLLRLLIVPAVPLIQLDRGVPFGGLLLFFVLFLAVVGIRPFPTSCASTPCRPCSPTSSSLC